MGSVAQWAGVIPNVVVTAVDGIAGFTTYALTLTLPDTARNMFFQDGSASGVDIGGVNPQLWEAFLDSQYDSCLSVGLTEGLTGGEISNQGEFD